MYFPYLYGRAEELRALRAVGAELPIRSTVVPILEPVKNDVRDLVRGLNELGTARVNVIVVVNPRQGDFSHADSRGLRGNLTEVFANHDSIVPSLIFDSRSSPRNVQTLLNNYRGKDIALIYKSPELEDDELGVLADERRIRFHVNRHDGLDPAQRALLPRTKLVSIRNAFNALDRNADYDGREFFTDGHQTFRGHSFGFGDYSITGPIYRPGGGPAHAVAIHGMFQQARTGQVWVEHFVSDDTDRDVGNVAEKFHQAAIKLVRACTARPREFGADEALAAFAADVRNNHFPGLGVSKRRQIQHHIALNHAILTD
jgi:hypothetical protein